MGGSVAKIHLVDPIAWAGGYAYCGMMTGLHRMAKVYGSGHIEGVRGLEEWVKIPESKQCAKCVKKARRLRKEKL